MNEYGGTHAMAVDMPPRCDHTNGYAVIMGRLYCGSCKDSSSVPKTWAVRGDVRRGVVDPGTGLLNFGAFTTSMVNSFTTSTTKATTSMGMFSNQWKRNAGIAARISEEVTQRMLEDWKNKRIGDIISC